MFLYILLELNIPWSCFKMLQVGMEENSSDSQNGINFLQHWEVETTLLYVVDVNDMFYTTLFSYQCIVHCNEMHCECM